VQKAGRNAVDLKSDGASHTVHLTWLAATASEQMNVAPGH
jgi:hypothetical protein